MKKPIITVMCKLAHSQRKIIKKINPCHYRAKIKAKIMTYKPDEHTLTGQALVARICSIEAGVSVNRKMLCKIIASIENKPFDEVMKEASEDHLRVSQGLLELLPLK